MDEVNKFFSYKNRIENNLGAEAFETENYLEVIKAFSRLTYQSLYVIDYEKKIFEYVSDNPLFLCNCTPEEVQNLGYLFYFKNVIKDDLELLFKINEAGFNFFDKLPLEERKMHTISYDFHLVTENKSAILINHKLTPLFLSKDGKMWKAMCIVSLSPNSSSGNINIYKQGTDDIWEYNLIAEKWTLRKKLRLSERELEILRLYAQGLTINEIAQKIFISADTVKFHRRKLFEKLGVSNITEALAYVTNNKLL
ncbi:response regulator transcription factor [Chryseobacterium sp. VD8]|uniref:response regulator transcription factor n=1 Tax=Chryseobacterium sp. VD8 TaxID=3081254 RepID=UPI00301874C9